MKKLIYILIAAVLAVTACTPKDDYNHPYESGIPSAAGLTPVITVDNETNQVNFALPGDAAEGLIPVWNFQDKSGEWTVWQAQQGFNKIYPAAGNYEVRMYVLNANGISPDYVTGTFTIVNTLVDFTRYYTLFARGPWHIDGETAGHMACGESSDNPSNWWSAPVNDKAAFGVYDNRLTFSSDGQYTFDPGAAGSVYVNIGVTLAPYVDAKGDATADYCAPATQQTTEYTFQVEGENVYLVLQQGAFFPYIPNDAFINNPRLLVKELSGKQIVLVSVDPAICWQYILTNTTGGGSTGSGDPLYGTSSKSWVMAKDMAQHMGCGESESNPTGWWSAAPNEKDGMGLYDNVLTFSKDGTYEFDPGEDGLIYVNWGCSTVDGQSHSEPDFTYSWQKQTGKYTYDGISLTLPANFTIGYIPNDDCYANPVFKVTELTDDKMVLVSVTDAISWQFIFVPAGGQGGETPGGESAAFVYDDDSNLWKKADEAHSLSQYYATTGSWTVQENPEVTQSGNAYSCTFPLATVNQWQAQLHIIPTEPVALSAEKTYDFQCKVELSQNVGGMTFKLTDTTDDGNFLFTEQRSITAFEEFTFTLTGLQGIDAESVKMVFDFGGCPDNTAITVKEIILRESVAGAQPGGEEPGGNAAAFSYDDADNYWKSADAAHELSQYYAITGSWTVQENPEVTQNGNAYSCTFPLATVNQWQAQLHIIPTDPIAQIGRAHV